MKKYVHLGYIKLQHRLRLPKFRPVVESFCDHGDSG